MCIFLQAVSYPIKLNNAAILRKEALYKRWVEEEVQRYSTAFTCYFDLFQGVCIVLHEDEVQIKHMKSCILCASVFNTELSGWCKASAVLHLSCSGKRRCVRRTFRSSCPRLSADTWRHASVNRRQLWPANV